MKEGELTDVVIAQVAEEAHDDELAPNVVQKVEEENVVPLRARASVVRDVGAPATVPGAELASELEAS